MINKDRAADLRLRRVFGITLVEYNNILAAQHGVCKICGRQPAKVRLAVDHDHRFDRIKIKISKFSNLFKGLAYNPFLNVFIELVHPNRKELRKLIKLMLRRRSIRGLLCMNCNRGLQKFYDKPERFEAAAKYLREFERRIINEKISTKHIFGNDSSITSILNL
jgi:hypothetical protein